jgi:tetratricopeptide (TPR) repeat protein
MDFQSKAQLILAQTFWLQGFPDRAVDAVSEAERFETPNDLSTCQALIIAMEMFRLMRDWDALETRLDRLVRLAGDASLEPYAWLGTGFKGELALRRGNVELAMDILRDAIPRLEADRFELYLPWLRRALSEGLAARGYWDQALNLVRGEIESILERRGAYYAPEFLRVHGDLLTGAGDESEAEAQYLRSIALAKDQGALSWQLRTTSSLARLRFRQGRQAEADTMLTDVLAAFTEGFGTEDLKEARLLIGQPGSPDTSG